MFEVRSRSVLVWVFTSQSPVPKLSLSDVAAKLFMEFHSWGYVVNSERAVVQ